MSSRPKRSAAEFRSPTHNNKNQLIVQTLVISTEAKRSGETCFSNLDHQAQTRSNLPTRYTSRIRSPTPSPRLALALLTAALLHSAALAQTTPVSVTTLGAACDFDSSPQHPTDDAPILQRIFDGEIHQPDGRRYEALSFPVGRCYLREPLVIRDLALSLSGTGAAAASGLVADFAPSIWTSPNHTALTVAPTAPGFVLGQHLGGFSVLGLHNETSVTTGLALHGAGAPLFLKGLALSNLVIQNFDTCIAATNTTNSTLNTLHLASCRAGIDLSGQNVNLSVDHLFADNFGHTNTASRAPTVGLHIDRASNTGPGPEGISFINSSILSADTALDVGQVLHLTVLDDILDLSHGTAANLRNPNGVMIRDSYISSNGKADALIAIGPGTNLDGIDIIDNFLNGDGTAFGILISAGTHRGLHLERNRIQGSGRPIQLNVVPVFSTIIGNYGYGNRGPFLTLTETTKGCGAGTRIDSNTSTDPQPILESHCAGAYSVGYNASPAQTLTGH